MASSAVKSKAVVKNEAPGKPNPPAAPGRFDVLASAVTGGTRPGRVAPAKPAEPAKPAAIAPAPAAPPKPAAAARAADPAPVAATPSVAKMGGLPARAGSVLIDNFERANALGNGKAVQTVTVTLPLHLRMVEWNGGYLIGLVDGRKSTYAECEFFGNKEDADKAWKEWLIACAA